MTGNDTTLLIGRDDVVRLLPMAACIDAVEEAFRRHGNRSVPSPSILGMHAAEGGFHIKAALYPDGAGRNRFVSKTNANFPRNMERTGLPTIQGVILVCDASDGRVLALMDSMEITILRTGAATAVAAKYLARPDASVLTIAGCGRQGRAQFRALSAWRRPERVYVWDSNAAEATRMASEMERESGVPFEVVGALRDGTLRSDVVVTCSPALRPILDRSDVRAGTFVAGVGADSEDKSELSPALLSSATVVVDVLDQCATIGDLHHALEAGAVTRADVHAELGEIVAGQRPGRRSDDEITVFDSTGMALQDAAAALLTYARASDAGVGMPFDFGGGPVP